MCVNYDLCEVTLDTQYYIIFKLIVGSYNLVYYGGEIGGGGSNCGGNGGGGGDAVVVSVVIFFFYVKSQFLLRCLRSVCDKQIRHHSYLMYLNFSLKFKGTRAQNFGLENTYLKI